MGLQEIYGRYSSPDRGGDKGTQHSYIELYGEYIQPGIESLLEIGVWEGQSLAMWQEYLPGTRVVGLDIDLSRLRYEVDARSCDATNRESVDDALANEMFDVIIDDGSHRVHHQIESFNILWTRVKPGGHYFIEDIAGPDALRVLMEALDKARTEYAVYDMRANKNRFDDILVRISK
jgi:SAM-dependent methyltransferase